MAMTKQMLLAWTILLGVVHQAGAIVYCPPNGARIWDPSIIYHEGRYYAFMMYGPPEGEMMDSVGLAVSPDGVHWKDHGPVITDDITVFKCFVAKVGDKFSLNHGSFTGHGTARRKQNRMCYYASEDLLNWEFLYADQPNPEFYDPDRRWDHMYILPKSESDPSAGYWGYIVAESADGNGVCGMQESDDGLRWRQLPPPEVEWDGFEPHLLELGGCERLDGRYYLIGGRVDDMKGFGNYGVFTFVADDPRGPFRPDKEAFRLCGTTGYQTWGPTFLAAFTRGRDGEILVSNYLSGGRLGSPGVWMLPLRKAVVDPEGHLRLGYWPGNESAKGEPIPMKADQFVRYGGAATDAEAAGALEVSVGRPRSRAQRFEDEIAVVRSGGEPLDLQGGVIVEATLQATPCGVRPRAGFLIEETGGAGIAALLEVTYPWRRRTMIGRLDYRALPEADVDKTLTDKTLVTWCQPADLEQRGVAPLAIEGQGNVFDAIVLGECREATWMAGSDYFQRTHRDQANWAREEAIGELVQIAIAYAGKQVTIYRNGEKMASYEIDQPAAFTDTPIVLFGKRYQGARDCFRGVMEEARLYDQALTAEQIQALEPGADSGPKPLGWWDFEGKALKDRMGNFPTGELAGNARLADGALHLAADGDFAIVKPEVTMASFSPIDVVREGEAMVRGIAPDKAVSLRLWIRKGMFEFYIDDRLARVGLYDQDEATGRIGFVVQNGAMTVSDLEVWKMNFDDAAQQRPVPQSEPSR